ncbi:MAG: efflux RND transporter periplasmic adaptor subunit [Halieaceae bacterium]
MRRLLIVTLVLGLIACADEPPPPPLVNVIVDTVILDPYQPKASFVGRLHAEDDVSIQARVSGYLLSHNFKEGDTVTAGDLLYQIDPAEFEAQMARAKADLTKAKAGQAVAGRHFRRGEELLPDGNISASEMDKLTAAKLEADANVESAQAQLKTAEVNMGYTRILAPISGRIGRNKFSTGDLVGPNTGTLTTLVSVDPIQALFQLSEAQYVANVVQRLGSASTRALADSDMSDLRVLIELTNRKFYPEVGRIDYIANRISEDTGTLEARASIPNPHGHLYPGQYVRVVLESETLLEALYVPQASVQADQQGNYVLIVNSGIVDRRNVVLDERVDDMVVVRQGVEEGDMVIVRGLQQVRPGQPVTTTAVAKAED